MKSIAILFLMVILSACGQKGSLFIPEPSADDKTTSDSADTQQPEQNNKKID